MADSATKKPLTFGVELEFILATLRDRDRDPHPEDPRIVRGISNTPDSSMQGYANVQRHIAATLNAAGFDALARADKIGDDHPPNDVWYITWDVSLQAVDEEYIWYQIEMNSPPLYATPDGILIVQKVCALLKRTYRINHNSSSGLHVHVGNGTAENLPFDTVQNLFATVWAFEDFFNQMHPRLRLYYNQWSPVVHDTSFLAFTLDNEELIDRPAVDRREPAAVRVLKEQGLRIIFEQTKMDELCHIADQTGGRSSVNFNNLCNSVAPSTIEFRKHQGTTNPERIAQWVQFCVGIVEFAGEVSPARLRKFLFSKIRDPDFGLVEILHAIGLPLQARYYGNLARERKYHDDRLGLLDGDDDETEGMLFDLLRLDEYDADMY